MNFFFSRTEVKLHWYLEEDGIEHKVDQKVYRLKTDMIRIWWRVPLCQ